MGSTDLGRTRRCVVQTPLKPMQFAARLLPVMRPGGFPQITRLDAATVTQRIDNTDK